MWTSGRGALVALLVVGSLALAGGAADDAAPGATADASPATSDTALRLDPEFFLKQIFDKYGHQGIMTFEGFEHLLESLGLGRLEFDRRHGVGLHRAADGSFQEMHDALHLHAHTHAAATGNAPAAPTGDTAASPDTKDIEAHGVRQRRRVGRRGAGANEMPPLCLSPRDMLMGFGLQGSHGVAIDPQRFLLMCPVIVYELDQRSCYFSDAATAPPPRRGPHPSAWRLAALSVLAASGVGLAAAAAGGLLLDVRRLRPVVQPALDVLVAVGAGTLCGDALLHLLPHVFTAHRDGGDEHGDAEGEEGGHSQDTVLRAAAAFASIAALFALESLLRRRGARAGQREGAKSDGDEAWEVQGAINHGDESSAAVEEGHGHSHGSGPNASVWMVLLGDGVHNLTDGLAVGAAFCDDPVAGFATALAIFCHELPHEFGDFAVLLKSGMSLRRALFYNVLSSILSFIGMAIGVWVGNLDTASQWIYAVTAGSFLYIALVDLIPELCRNTSQSKTAITPCLHILGIFIGGGIMLVIALYEDVLRTLFE